VSATRDALESVVRKLVEHPEGVILREHVSGRRRSLELQVDPDDMGAIIGRRGRTADALRCLLRVRSDSYGETYDLKIREKDDQ